MDEVMHNVSAENVGVELVMNERLYDLEYTDDVVCLFNTAGNAQFALFRLVRAVTPFGMCFSPSKYKVGYEDWDSPEPLLIPIGVRSDVVDRFTYLGNCLSNDGSTGSEVNARIGKFSSSVAQR